MQQLIMKRSFWSAFNFVAAVCGLVVASNPAFSAELKIFGSRVTKMMVDDIGPQFERATGHKLLRRPCRRCDEAQNQSGDFDSRSGKFQTEAINKAS